MSTEVMIDLECLSTASDAAIVQIGAVLFDPENGATQDTLCVFITDSEGSVDVKTVAWWLRQGEAAQALGDALQVKGTNEKTALMALAQFLQHRRCEAVWCHGLTYDLPILASAYRRHRLPVPWGYRDGSDTRTIYRLLADRKPPAVDLPGVKHSAVDDCLVQIAQLTAARQQLRALGVPA